MALYIELKSQCTIDYELVRADCGAAFVSLIC